jgi:hypothetical protein
MRHADGVSSRPVSSAFIGERTGVGLGEVDLALIHTRDSSAEFEVRALDVVKTRKRNHR